MEKGAGGFGEDGVAFWDKGAANFRGRGERAEAKERVQRLGQMAVRAQQITQPALHDGRGSADQDIVGRGNVQTLDLDLRPMRDFLLETDAAMPDQRNIEQILLLHDGFAGKRVGLGQQKPAAACRIKGSGFPPIETSRLIYGASALSVIFRFPRRNSGFPPNHENPFCMSICDRTLPTVY